MGSFIAGFQRTKFHHEHLSRRHRPRVLYLRNCGRESFHLFRDESSSATTRCSHSGPMRPVRIFDFFVEYKVLRAKARISHCLSKHTNDVILQGFPGGCLKACSGSSVSQYSSSHSIGYSTSKLFLARKQFSYI